MEEFAPIGAISLMVNSILDFFLSRIANRKSCKLIPTAKMAEKHGGVPIQFNHSQMMILMLTWQS